MDDPHAPNLHAPFHAQCSAAVLAGGKSSRMGLDKARLELGGEPLIQRVLRPLIALFDDVFVVANDASLSSFGVPVWPDALPGGPLGGVLTALEHAERRQCLVVACDMPFLSPTLIRYMTEVADGVAIVAPRDDRGWHPLHAIYPRTAAPAIAARIAEERLAIHPLFEVLAMREITPVEVARFARPGRDPLANVNTPEQLEQARALI